MHVQILCCSNFINYNHSLSTLISHVLFSPKFHPGHGLLLSRKIPTEKRLSISFHDSKK